MLVTAGRDSAALWRLRLGVASAEGAGGIPFGREAETAWGNAAGALPRAIPVLWSSVRQVETSTRAAHHLVSLFGGSPIVLDGPSFGLPFLLAMASRLLGEPLPEDVVASASISPSGQVGGVGDIEAKIEALDRLSPRVCRLLVACPDAARAGDAAAGTRIEVIALRTAAQALMAVFPDLSNLLVAAGSDPGRRKELVDRFFRLAVSGRGAMLEWGAVRAAARRALEEWGRTLDEGDRRKLDFAHAVAARHENNEGALDLPEDGWLAQMPLPERLRVVANFVQQAADTGTPPPDATEALARRFLVEVLEAFPPHLKLEGALGRLLAVTGREGEALEFQEEAARGFLVQEAYEDVSYPLAEWYRLSGVLADRGAFDRADEFRATLPPDRAGFVDATAPRDPYVHLARARALVLLGLVRGDDPERTLERLAMSEQMPYHVRWSAVRWYVRLLEGQGRREAAAPVLAALDGAARPEGGGSEAPVARRFRALIELDRAERAGDPAMAREPLDVLQQLQPGILGHLLARATPGREGATVARLFPY